MKLEDRMERDGKKYRKRAVKYRIFFSLLLGIALFAAMALVPMTRILPSMLVMSWNNMIQGRTALTEAESVHIDFPAGKVSSSQNWYPFMLIYDASDSFSKWIERPVQLTILYNFSAYDAWAGRSRFYESGSVYEGAFYGAYLLKEPEAVSYLFRDRGVNAAALESLGKFDYTWLVLSSLGAKSGQVIFDTEDTVYSAKTIDGLDFTVATSRISTNSPVHSYKTFKEAYFQFGLPTKETTQDFPSLTMYSRVWVTKIEEKNMTLVLYAMSPDLKFLDEMTDTLIETVHISVEKN